MNIRLGNTPSKRHNNKTKYQYQKKYKVNTQQITDCLYKLY